jgi:hypothetical protein
MDDRCSDRGNDFSARHHVKTSTWTHTRSHAVSTKENHGVKWTQRATYHSVHLKPGPTTQRASPKPRTRFRPRNNCKHVLPHANISGHLPISSCNTPNVCVDHRRKWNRYNTRNMSPKNCYPFLDKTSKRWKFVVIHTHTERLISSHGKITLNYFLK